MGHPSGRVGAIVGVAGIVQELMEGEGEARSQQALADVVPRGRSIHTVDSNNFLEKLVMPGSVFWCDSETFKIGGSE